MIRFYLVLFCWVATACTACASSQLYSFSTLAGLARDSNGTADGTNSNARFYYPRGVALGAGGVVFVADTYNHTIRKISPAGVVTTLAGSPGTSGSADGTGGSDQFNYPTGLAVDGSGNVYVADSGNTTIRKISPAGVVTTLAGLAGIHGSTDGTNAQARFDTPYSVAVDNLQNVYVADSGNHTIRMINAAGVVTTLAGLAGSNGSADGTNSAARFYHPTGLAVDGAGNVYVADSGNHTIRKITPSGIVSTLAGSAGGFGTADGLGGFARFADPDAVAVDGLGNVYVADCHFSTIRKISPVGLVSTLAGFAGAFGSNDGLGALAHFNYPQGIAADSAGNLYVADTYNHSIRAITPLGAVTTLAGQSGAFGTDDGTGSTARFDYSEGVAVDNLGAIYVADTYNHAIRKITPAGVVTTLAGQPGLAGTNNGLAQLALFNYPRSVAVDTNGFVYVADCGNHTIRKITPAGLVSTLAGLGGNNGTTDGTNSDARFSSPYGVAVDAMGNVFVADTGNTTIRKITPDGLVTTLAGLAGCYGSVDGTNSQARFFYPAGIAVGANGTVYVADTYNHTIRQITPAGVVSTLAGVPGNIGSLDGTNGVALFNYPAGLSVDNAGNVHVADTYNHTIRRITPAGQVSTLAGWAGAYGSTDGMNAFARFNNPRGVALDSAGNIYVADTLNHTIRKGAPYYGPVIAAQPLNQSAALATAVVFNLAVTGPAPFFYQWLKNGTPLPGATNSTLTLPNVATNDVGIYNVVVSNAFASVTSDSATLSLLPPPVNDPFASPTRLSGTNITIIGTSVNATREPGEPNHANIVGGHSVWWTWVAPTNGPVQIDTTGSAFDTLLAVYTGNSVSNLTPIVSNDDYIGVTSFVSFNAVAGTTYQIAVDGYSGANGTIILNLKWFLPVVPSIVAQPQNQTEISGASVAFNTIASGSPLLSYQWRINGVNIPGAVNPTLALVNVNSNSAGTYDAIVSNPFGSTATSGALLTITPGFDFNTLAGDSGHGSTDGAGSLARFDYPFGVALDAATNIYVADYGNNTIRKITPAGVVTTPAGSAGILGSANGSGSDALFRHPESLVVDPLGNIFIADTYNNSVRKLTPAGVVTTLAGFTGAPGTHDGEGANSQFHYPGGVALDTSGNLFVADTFNHTIRKISPVGVTSTFAGLATFSGSTDGAATNARFANPAGLTMDNLGNLYVADAGNNTIRKITPDGLVSTIAGLAGVIGSADGLTNNARFSNPSSVALDTLGNLYIADAGNNTIRKITPIGVVSTVAGMAGAGGSVDGVGTNARFSDPSSAAVDASGNLYVADTGNHTVRKITPSGVVTTIAGAVGSASIDGATAVARFKFPGGITVDGSRNVYVSDTGSHAIRKISPDGFVSTFAGLSGFSGTNDGLGSLARFNSPAGLASDSAGDVYVADASNNAIRKISPTGFVITLAGLAGVSGTNDGPGEAARFSNPCGVAVDGFGNIYVADTSNNTIRRIRPGGLVSTFAGLAGPSGSADGTKSQARFFAPQGIAVDANGTIYVADTYNATIRKITPAGVVTTLAGWVGVTGNLDGFGPNARFSTPSGLAVDGAGNIYVADSGNSLIRKITPAGMVSTVGGSAGSTGSLNGNGTAATFFNPQAIAIDGFGSLYIADSANYSIRLSPNSVPFGPQLQITASANQLVLAWPKYLTGFILETSPRLLPAPIWTPVTNAVQIAVNTYAVTNVPSLNPVFYRLHKTIIDIPALQIAAAPGNKFVLTWPATATGFILETSPAVSAGSLWTPITSGITTVGANFVLTNTPTSSSAYFRLHLP